jgi:Zn-dependent oligopeptidase
LEKDYQINSEEIKEYFPLQKVIDGMLSVYEEV